MVESLFLCCKGQQVSAVLVLEAHSLGIVDKDFEIGLKRRRALVVAPESAAVNAHLGFSRRIDSLVADMTRSIQRKKKSDLVH